MWALPDLYSGLVGVADVELALHRDQEGAAHGLGLLGVEDDRAGGLAVLEGRADFGVGGQLALGVLFSSGVLKLFREFLVALVNCLEVREGELKVEQLDVVGGADPVGHVRHVRVLEAADDVDEERRVAHVREYLVRALLFRGGRAEAGDIDELDGSRDFALGLEHGGEPVEPGIGHGDDAEVRILARRGKVRGLGFYACQGGEDGALPDCRQADDSAIQGHG